MIDYTKMRLGRVINNYWSYLKQYIIVCPKCLRKGKVEHYDSATCYFVCHSEPRNIFSLKKDDRCKVLYELGEREKLDKIS